MTTSTTRKLKKVSPGLRKELARATYQRAQAERAFRSTILRGVRDGESIAAMARVIDPTGETVDRRLLWAWIQNWQNGDSDDG